MKLDIISEVWSMVKESIISTDRDVIAENLVGLLIDNDYSPGEIKTAFRGDYDVITALKEYVDNAVEFEDDFDEESEYEEYDTDEDDDDDWE